jgi:hypothetical protein
MLSAWILVSLSLVAEHYRDVLVYGASCGSDHRAASGNLAGGLVVIAIEFAIIVAIVRPWSYQRSWLRSLAVSVLFFLASGLLVTTCGPSDIFTEYHAMWLLGVTATFFFFTLWSGVAALTCTRSDCPPCP